MTEETLDKLRTHAARMHDEASRLVRALKGSNANEEQVREHLGNVEDAARKCREDGLAVPVADWPPTVEIRDGDAVTFGEGLGVPVDVPHALTVMASPQQPKKSRRGKGDA